MFTAIVALAIAAGQVAVDRSSARTKTILASTIALTVVLAAWALLDWNSKRKELAENEQRISEFLQQGPATYQDILEQRGLGDIAADEALKSLDKKKIVLSDVDGFKVGSSNHRVRIFRLAKPL